MFSPQPTCPPAAPGPMTCARLRQWVLDARPNARAPYAHGYVLANACSPELRQYVMALAEMGYLTPHMVRGDDGAPLYIVQRTGRPVAKGAKL